MEILMLTDDHHTAVSTRRLQATSCPHGIVIIRCCSNAGHPIVRDNCRRDRPRSDMEEDIPYIQAKQDVLVHQQSGTKHHYLKRR